MREMKDSGVEWIGEIPEDWNVGKTLYALSMPITDGPHETPELFDEGIPFISAEAVSCGNGHIDFEHIRGFISQEFYEECCKKYIPQINDIYMIKSGATTGKVAKVETQKLFTIWSPLAVFRVKPQKCYYEYLYYFIKSDAYQKQIENKWTYGTQQNIGMRTLEKLLICFPSIIQQKLIADYLDAKCSKINEIIEKQQAIIEKLKEYKLSVIIETVTKGLNPNVEMKDSGVEWIGQMPTSWDCTTVGRIAMVVRGASPRPAGDPLYFNGNDVPWITVAEVTKGDGKYIDGTETYLTFEGAKQSRIVEEGTLLLSNSGATLGVPKITRIRGCINDGSVAFYNLSINQEFLLYLFKGRTFELRKQMQGYGQPNLNTTIVKGIEVTLPTELEQKLIVDFLDQKCTAIEKTIEDREKAIDKLQEYKKSLIYEVVTGKKEV